MVSKEKFIEIMQFLKEKNDAWNEIESIIQNHYKVFGDSTTGFSQTDDIIISLLEESLNLPIGDYYGSTLSYWIYEAEFGEKFHVGDIENINLPEDHEYRKPDLTDLEKLYDYLVWEGSQKD